MLEMRYRILACLLAAKCCLLTAAEPNETFATATILPPGALLVNDLLTAQHPFPDTLLGILTAGGEINETNDDNSLYGNGFASGLQNVSVAGSSIRFAVTGFEDEGFAGEHQEVGQYEVFIDVRNSQGATIDSFSELRTLGPSIVHEFMFEDEDWQGGAYNVNIENRRPPNDIDFFTFTGLAPNSEFSARTLNPSIPTLDTVLGWFDDTGSLITSNDDYGELKLSRIEGIVPGSGQLTFAVTGFGDSDFGGLHSQAGGYSLQLEANLEPVPGDYNGDRRVNAADYTVWRNARLQNPPNLAADGTKDGEVDVEDYLFWKMHYGEGMGGAGAATIELNSVPEPLGGLQVLILAVLLGIRRQFAAKRSILRWCAVSAAGAAK